VGDGRKTVLSSIWKPAAGRQILNFRLHRLEFSLGGSTAPQEKGECRDTSKHEANKTEEADDAPVHAGCER